MSVDGSHWGQLPGAFTGGAGGGISEQFTQPFYQPGVVPSALSQVRGGSPTIAAIQAIAQQAQQGVPLAWQTPRSTAAPLVTSTTTSPASDRPPRTTSTPTAGSKHRLEARCVVSRSGLTGPGIDGPAHPQPRQWT
jgi:hypothetical protein